MSRYSDSKLVTNPTQVFSAVTQFDLGVWRISDAEHVTIQWARYNAATAAGLQLVTATGTAQAVAGLRVYTSAASIEWIRQGAGRENTQLPHWHEPPELAFATFPTNDAANQGDYVLLRENPWELLQLRLDVAIQPFTGLYVHLFQGA